MAGPILEAVKDRMSSDDSIGDTILSESPLVDSYQDELGRRMPSGGGCCSAAEVAETIRNEQQYD